MACKKQSSASMLGMFGSYISAFNEDSEWSHNNNIKWYAETGLYDDVLYSEKKLSKNGFVYGKYTNDDKANRIKACSNNLPPVYDLTLKSTFGIDEEGFIDQDCIYHIRCENMKNRIGINDISKHIVSTEMHPQMGEIEIHRPRTVKGIKGDFGINIYEIVRQLFVVTCNFGGIEYIQNLEKQEAIEEAKAKSKLKKIKKLSKIEREKKKKEIKRKLNTKVREFFKKKKEPWFIWNPATQTPFTTEQLFEMLDMFKKYVEKLKKEIKKSQEEVKKTNTVNTLTTVSKKTSSLIWKTTLIASFLVSSPVAVGMIAGASFLAYLIDFVLVPFLEGWKENSGHWTELFEQWNDPNIKLSAKAMNSLNMISNMTVLRNYRSLLEGGGALQDAVWFGENILDGPVSGKWEGKTGQIASSIIGEKNAGLITTGLTVLNLWRGFEASKLDNKCGDLYLSALSSENRKKILIECSKQNDSIKTSLVKKDAPKLSESGISKWSSFYKKNKITPKIKLSSQNTKSQYSYEASIDFHNQIILQQKINQEFLKLNNISHKHSELLIDDIFDEIIHDKILYKIVSYLLSKNGSSNAQELERRIKQDFREFPIGHDVSGKLVGLIQVSNSKKKFTKNFTFYIDLYDKYFITTQKAVNISSFYNSKDKISLRPEYNTITLEELKYKKKQSESFVPALFSQTFVKAKGKFTEKLSHLLDTPCGQVAWKKTLKSIKEVDSENGYDHEVLSIHPKIWSEAFKHHSKTSGWVSEDFNWTEINCADVKRIKSNHCKELTTANSQWRKLSWKKRGEIIKKYSKTHNKLNTKKVMNVWAKKNKNGNNKKKQVSKMKNRIRLVMKKNSKKYLR